MNKRVVLFSLLAAFTACRPCSTDHFICERQDAILASAYIHPSYDFSQLTNVLILPLDNPLKQEAIETHREELTLSLMRNFSEQHAINIQFDRNYQATKTPLIHLDTQQVDRIKLGAIGQTYHAQAALQVSVVDYQPFAPMRMKVKAMLVEIKSGETLWAFDHVFDSDNQATLAAMQNWWKKEMKGGDRRNHFDLATVRPSLFSNFVFYYMAKSASKPLHEKNDASLKKVGF